MGYNIMKTFNIRLNNDTEISAERVDFCTDDTGIMVVAYSDYPRMFNACEIDEIQYLGHEGAIKALCDVLGY